MDVEEVKSVVDDLPMMTIDQARKITNLILSKKLKNLLELGFYHGVSSCYLAGALDEMKEGHLTTIDMTSAETREPNIEQLLEKLGLSSYVTVYYEPTSYNWRLMKFIEENPKPIFDFCYIDGGHDWYNSGFAFLLVDKLLKPGGWVLFDDLYWTYVNSDALKNTEMVKRMPPEERETAQVKKVFELLVKPHPKYHNFIEDGSWAYAQKKKSFWDRF